MQEAIRLAWFRLRAIHRIAWSLLLSLIIHLALFATIELSNRFDLWRFTPMAFLARLLGAAPRPAESSPASASAAAIEPEAREVPMIFVDVDPSQATVETPPDTPFYSPVNSLAADPDPVDDQAQPRLDGKQDKVLKTLATERGAAIPLQPASPPETPPASPAGEPAPEVVEPVAAAPKPAEPTLAKVEPVERVVPRIASGDFEAAKPAPPRPVASAVPSGTGTAPRERPRTLAAARANQNVNPHSALVGEKYKQDGGVRRFSVQSSLDVRGSPFGNYDARFVSIVQQCWLELLEQQRYTLDRVGKVVLRFKLSFDGRIRDMETVESNVGEISRSSAKWPSPNRHPTTNGPPRCAS
jgi:hypothetical protein